MGPYIARLINTLVEKFNVKLSDVHIVGHSLGAHIAGIGKTIAAMTFAICYIISTILQLAKT